MKALILAVQVILTDEHGLQHPATAYRCPLCSNTFYDIEPDEVCHKCGGCGEWLEIPEPSISYGEEP